LWFSFDFLLGGAGNLIFFLIFGYFVGILRITRKIPQFPAFPNEALKKSENKIY
jgi:F0F1-type ATP synthase assembly protein I